MPSQSSFTNGPACLGRVLAWGKVRREAFLPRESQAGCPNSLGFPLEHLPSPWKWGLLSRGRETVVTCRLALLESAQPHCRPSPALPNRGMETGPKRDILSTSFCPTCPSVHYGKANADTTFTLHQALGNPANPQGHCVHFADGETEAQACSSLLCLLLH